MIRRPIFFPGRGINAPKTILPDGSDKAGWEKQDRQQALSIIKSDRDVNDMERGIVTKCLSRITRQQPVEGELRIVSAALKAVTDLERIDDHAVNIAEWEIFRETGGMENVRLL